MQEAYGLTIPDSLEEICDPGKTALLVYDMQVGILSQIAGGEQIREGVLEVLQAARHAGVRVFFSRHLSLPKEAMGVFQLRQAMMWQRVETVEQVRPWFLRDAPGTAIIPELSPLPSEVVFDKITMSAFEGTLLNLALRDCDIRSFVVVGVAMEVGIEPTVRHATDLGYIPVVVTDAYGAGNEEAGRRSLAGLEFTGDALITDKESLCRFWQPPQ